jgi:hypothetical protein
MRAMMTSVCVDMANIVEGRASLGVHIIQMNVATAERLQMIRITATSNVAFQILQFALFEALPLSL